MRILVTGSRYYGAILGAEDRRVHCQWHHDQLNEALSAYAPDRILHGGCPSGADAMAEAWAQRHNVPTIPFAAHWLAHGKAAGPMRNQAMVDYGADLALAFWDQQSRGTKDCLDRIYKAGIPVRVFYHGEASAQNRTLPLFK